ncbi:1,2-phenylacetyl-CoA epoxidase subunit PaaD [Ulvibacter litoralis]|uniref:Ring-1,2-phenylacetyl-CoA epoxidase subunit PaaD n=1 Tax=Ulvibacter litoralis TaxID=227084 RepID=A0A1G7GC25_9FLAO|nr:1,2-phenylacetyl-CoA epoxidase subunit PaaD [Ulvibacter litoralis]GHC56847.1 phenylacetate-CoA oxygenase subunit PaaJ [Ulvibacter litoralis]SDE85676.1 ring-1,2-phenylacetyl-CoA epoxidase subunit PaaD [Ulvibacter litoralis]
MHLETTHIDPSLLPILETVSDPEIPVLSVLDLGVIREAFEEDGVVKIKLTPTYSGCPAMDVIGDDLRTAFAAIGKKAVVQLVLAPAWTTDWISEAGKQKMEEYGIAAPLSETADKDALLGNAKVVRCTNCGSQNTHLVSQFGSTACKALFKCDDCQEPFDYFKCLK